MRITQKLLTPNEHSRPQTQKKEIPEMVMHGTANPYADALQNRDFFENKKTGMGGYGSAHYIIGQDGEILRCIPESEIAYH